MALFCAVQVLVLRPGDNVSDWCCLLEKKRNGKLSVTHEAQLPLQVAT